MPLYSIPVAKSSYLGPSKATVVPFDPLINHPKDISMPAFVVMTRERTTNATELDNYRSKGPATLDGRPATPLAFYGALDVLDGEQIEAAAILQFPTAKEARDWYESPEYQEARAHRLKGGDYQVFIVDGI
jgi:uncharacterized protein (DUF1330 family)